jgi:hypothetical protein
MWAVESPLIDPEPAGVAPAGTGKSVGQPAGSCPSRDSETVPSGVLTVNDRLGAVVVVEEPDRGDDEHPNKERPATAATAARRIRERR